METRFACEVQRLSGDALALDAAIAASSGGRRAVALLTSTAYIDAAASPTAGATAGATGAAGLVIVLSEDPDLPSADGCDARLAARAAKLPLLAPPTPQDALEFMKLAFTLSERHGVPVLLLTTPALAASIGPCHLSQPDPAKRAASAPAPAAGHDAAGRDAAGRDAFREKQLAAVEQYGSTAFECNNVLIGSPELGIIASGCAGASAREALPGASFLTLGLLHPMPRKLVGYFAALVKRLYVVEEGLPFLEEQIRALGISVAGKDLFPRTGALSPDLIAQGVGASGAALPALPATVPAPAAQAGPRQLGVRSFDEMLALVATLPKRRVAIAGGQNLAALHAGIECWKLGLGTPVFVGPSAAIRQLAREHFPDFDIDAVDIVEAEDDASIAEKSVALVRGGGADILLKGGVNTPTLMRAALSASTGLRAGNLLSDTFVFEYPDEDGLRLVMITDGGLNQLPTAQQKIDILGNAVTVAHALGNADPRVAMLAASETVSPALPASMDAAIIMQMNRAGRIGGCIVEGPIALDVAVSRKAAAIKGTASDVAGQADILVAASIDTANALAKSTTYFAGYRLSHVIVGATAPILIASRSDSSDAKLLSIALGSLMAKYFEEQRAT
jgi:phosphate butyryltransferase